MYVLIPIVVTSILRVNELGVSGNGSWEWSKMSFEAFCVVVFIYWKNFLDNVHNNNISENRPFPFFAASQLMEFRCSKFHESGTPLWVGRI